MEKYVSAEIAQRLKELGFKERVLTYYENGVPKLHNDITGWDFNTSFMTCVSRPTYSEAFRWFREKHDLACYIYRTNFTSYEWVIDIDESYAQDSELDYTSYEKAELACLDKLLEIINIKSE